MAAMAGGLGEGATSNSLIDSAFSKAADSAGAAGAGDGGAVSGAPDAVDDLEAGDGTQGKVQGEEEIDLGADAIPELEADDYTKPDSVDDKQHHFSKTKAERLITNSKAWDEIQSVIPNATVDSVKGLYKRSNAIDSFFADFKSGDPKDMDKVLSHLERSDPDSAVLLTMRAVDRLEARNPRAFQMVENRIAEGLISSLYTQAHRTQDPKLFKIAQNLDFHRTGKFTKMDEMGAKTDPNVERARELDRREQEFNQKTQAAQQAEINSWIQSAEAKVDTEGVDAAIDEALAPVKKAYGDKPAWKHMRRDLQEAVEAAITAAPEWRRAFSNAWRDARQSRTDEARDGLVSMMKSLATRVVMKERKAIIETHTNARIAKSQEAHSAFEGSQQKRESAGTGQAGSGKGVSVKAGIKNGTIKTNDDLFANLFK